MTVVVVASTKESTSGVSSIIILFSHIRD